MALSACNGTKTPPTAPTPAGSSSSYSISGVISVQDNAQVDSDTNNIMTDWKSNNSQPQILSTLPMQLIGYLNVAGQGAEGKQKQSGDLVDRFQITALGGERVTLDIPNTTTIDDDNPNRPNLDLYVLDQENQLIVKSVSKSGADETLLIPDLPGVYYIEVRLYQDDKHPGLFDSRTTYKLTIGDYSATVFENDTAWSAEDDFIIGDIIVKEKLHCYNSIINQTDIYQAAQAFQQDTNGQVTLYRFGSHVGSILDIDIAEPSSSNIVNKAYQKSPAVDLKAATLQLAIELNSYPCIEYAEPNYLRQSQIMPSDTMYAKHWQFAKIKLPQAWNISKGSSDIKIAVIDSGIVTSHPDFQNRVSDNGYDFIRNLNSSGDGDGIDSNPEDLGDGVDNPKCMIYNSDRVSSFHGTIVTGVLGASTDNDEGISGIDWYAEIMPLRVLGCLGASDYALSHAIRYAAGLYNQSGIKLSSPVDIINLSLGSPSKGKTLGDAISDAANAGAIIIAAAGNDGTDTPWYPAAFPQVTSVVATDINNQKASFANYGAHIDVAAPGTGIWSTGASYEQNVIVPHYKAYQGTSIATPHVTGIASLMKSVYKAMSPDEFKAILISGNMTDDRGDIGRDDYFGFGLINAQKAVQYAKNINDGSVSVPITPIFHMDQSYINFGSNYSTIKVRATNIGSSNSNLAISEVSSSKNYINVTQSNSSDSTNQYQIQIDRQNLLPGSYSEWVQFSSNAGQKKISLAFNVTDPNKKFYGNAGNLSLYLTNLETNEITKIHIASPDKGEYGFEFNDVVAGSYRLMAGNDLDNNGVLCEAAEACVELPMRVVGSVKGINLTLEY